MAKPQKDLPKHMRGSTAVDVEEVGRRGLKRLPRRVMVRFTTDAGSPERTGFTKNLSIGGLFVRTNTVAKPGTTIQVELKFPDRSFKHWARVVWAKQVPPQLAHVLECGMGLSFINPPSEWQEYFRHWSGGD